MALGFETLELVLKPHLQHLSKYRHQLGRHQPCIQTSETDILTQTTTDTRLQNWDSLSVFRSTPPPNLFVVMDLPSSRKSALKDAQGHSDRGHSDRVRGLGAALSGSYNNLMLWQHNAVGVSRSWRIAMNGLHTCPSTLLVVEWLTVSQVPLRLGIVLICFWWCRCNKHDQE